VLVDIGLTAEPGQWSGSFRTEYELEASLEQATKSVQANATRAAAFGSFAIFSYPDWLQLTVNAPCLPADRSPCLPAEQRPPRALWLYELYNNSRSTNPAKRKQPKCAGPDGFQCDLLFDLQARRRFFAWCKARHVNMLYVQDYASIDQPARSWTGTPALWLSFISQADELGIDVMTFAGASTYPDIADYVARAADWCSKHKGLCGVRAKV